jgi:hypothetical protein
VALHKFLYEYTSYAADCGEVLPRMARDLAGPMGGWEAAWSYVKTHESVYIKARALEMVGGVPRVWPWISDDESVLRAHEFKIELRADRLPHDVLL